MMRKPALLGLQPAAGLPRARLLAAVALGVGLVMATGPVLAGDDDDEPEQTIEQGIIKNLMSGLGAKGMEDNSINYRERSPLVIPSKTDLPPPASSRKVAPVANWPKDPDEAARRAAIEESKRPAEDPALIGRPLTPSELATKPGRKRKDVGDSTTPGFSANPLSPSELGYTGGLFSNLFGKKDTESAQFKGEPTRDNLTMPPAGYQTPSPNYAYGVNTKDLIPK